MVVLNKWDEDDYRCFAFSQWEALLQRGWTGRVWFTMNVRLLWITKIGVAWKIDRRNFIPKETCHEATNDDEDQAF